MAEAKRTKKIHSLFDLTGRVAFITGGAGLLGQKHAEAIAEAGGHVVLVDQDRPRVREASKTVAQRHGVKTLGLACDITREEEVKETVEKAVKEFRKIDILINNAAMTAKEGTRSQNDYFAPFEDYPLQLWERALAVNLTGLFLCTQAVGRVMVRQKRGVVVNIASTAGVVGPHHAIYQGVKSPYSGKPFNTPIAYSTTKAGVINFTRYLATYWAKHNIRVNALSPGGVYDGHDPAFVKNYSSLVPMDRMAEQDEYKGAILFLVSDASSYMTGTNLIVDGGLTSW